MQYNSLEAGQRQSFDYGSCRMHKQRESSINSRYEAGFDLIEEKTKYLPFTLHKQHHLRSSRSVSQTMGQFLSLEYARYGYILLVNDKSCG